MGLVFASACSTSHVINENSKKQVLNQFNPTKDFGLDLPSIASQVDQAKKIGGKAPEFLASELFIKGNDAAMRGDYASSIAFFRFVNQLKPDAFVKKKLAMELVRAGEIGEAKNFLVEAYQENKKDESVALILAGIHTALEEPKEARKLYKDLIKSKHSNEACLYLAKSYTQSKEFNEAHKLLIQCENTDKTEPAFVFYRGKIEQERGNYQLAIGHYKNALKVDPTFTQALLAITGHYEEKEKFEDAIKVYKSFLDYEDNASNSIVISKYVNLLLTLDKNQEALPILEDLVQLENQDINLKVRLGLIYSDFSRNKDAIKILKEVYEVAPESDKILFYLGVLHQQEKEYDQSLDYFKKINTDSPLFEDASVQMANIFSNFAREEVVLGKTQKQLENLQLFVQERVKKTPDAKIELSLVLASFYDDLSEYKKALEIISPLESEKTFTESHAYYYASILEKDGDYLKAREIVGKMLTKNPNNAHALNFLGYSYLEKNEQMDKAYQYISKAVKLKPEDGYIRDSLAWYYFINGKYKEALVEAKKAYEMVKTDAIISKHLGMIYQKLNEWDKAIEYFQESLKVVKAVNEKEEILKLIKDIDQKRLPASIPTSP